MEIRQLDLRQYLQREGVSEVGLSSEHVLDRGGFVRNRDLGLHGELEATLADDLGVEFTDDRLDGFGHHRLAVDLPQVVDRDLARTEAAQLDRPADFTEPAGDLFLELAGRDDDAEFALEPLGAGFCHLHEGGPVPTK